MADDYFDKAIASCTDDADEFIKSGDYLVDTLKDFVAAGKCMVENGNRIKP